MERTYCEKIKLMLERGCNNYVKKEFKDWQSGEVIAADCFNSLNLRDLYQVSDYVRRCIEYVKSNQSNDGKSTL